MQCYACHPSLKQDNGVRAKLPWYLGGTVTVSLVLATVCMYIDRFTNETCIVAHTCTPIDPLWKGVMMSAAHRCNMLICVV